MDFTREPIIETVISPKEGSKLVVRNSKGGRQEEYFVDAIEIVSFGEAVFYRSTERPKSFLVPVSDYEVIELKETKMVLKSNSLEKSIKIGGGKVETENKMPKRKKGLKKPKDHSEFEEKRPEQPKSGTGDETQVSSSILRKLFPPPPNLIKEKFNHIKSPEKIDESVSEEIVKEIKPEIAKTEAPKAEENVQKEVIKETEVENKEPATEVEQKDLDEKKEE